MFKNILGQIGALWRQIERAGAEDRVVLAVTTFSSVQMELRIFSIQEGWRILFAKSLEAALMLSKIHKVTIVIYDLDLPDVEWRRGLRSFANGYPVFFILLSPVVDLRLWKAVLDNGGYDVVRTPVQRESLVPLVNGAFSLASCIDSAGELLRQSSIEGSRRACDH